ncbi:hypothetical protein [Thalassospira lucentensis]|uniref:hypothetical protein n=1 Tax=Thalassospira lucentensis TaxID=168935 RepID=UPI002943A031|nr:hypothetical protein [Thalassospira lucentensis]WOI09010.1 hypothetical protein R1T41_00855 [Thalassospira lucentensis]
MKFGKVLLMISAITAPGAAISQTWEGQEPQKTVRSETVPAAKEMRKSGTDLWGLLAQNYEVRGVVPWSTPRSAMVYLSRTDGAGTRFVSCVVDYSVSGEQLYQKNSCFEFRP